jgi:hypothetical protein
MHPFLSLTQSDESIYPILKFAQTKRMYCCASQDLFSDLYYCAILSNLLRNERCLATLTAGLTHQSRRWPSAGTARHCRFFCWKAAKPEKYRDSARVRIEAEVVDREVTRDALRKLSTAEFEQYEALLLKVTAPDQIVEATALPAEPEQ